MSIPLKITSTAFTHGGGIPQEYTCQGKSPTTIPPMAWEGIPQETLSLVFISDDPDAPGGTRDHGILYNIPPSIKVSSKLNDSAIEWGINSWGKAEYRGPCPPPGPEHRYFFKLYALNTILSFPTVSHKSDVEKVMHNHILAQTEIMGLYQRQ